jgi:hypothetical protein
MLDRSEQTNVFDPQSPAGTTDGDHRPDHPEDIAPSPPDPSGARHPKPRPIAHAEKGNPVPRFLLRTAKARRALRYASIAILLLTVVSHPLGCGASRTKTVVAPSITSNGQPPAGQTPISEPPPVTPLTTRTVTHRPPQNTRSAGHKRHSRNPVSRKPARAISHAGGATWPNQPAVVIPRVVLVPPVSETPDTSSRPVGSGEPETGIEFSFER